MVLFLRDGAASMLRDLLAPWIQLDALKNSLPFASLIHLYDLQHVQGWCDIQCDKNGELIVACESVSCHFIVNEKSEPAQESIQAKQRDATNDFQQLLCDMPRHSGTCSSLTHQNIGVANEGESVGTN